MSARGGLQGPPRQEARPSYLPLASPVTMAAPGEGGENKSANCWEGKREGGETPQARVAGLAIFSQELFLALPLPTPLQISALGKAAGRKGVKCPMLLLTGQPCPLLETPYPGHLQRNTPACLPTASGSGFGDSLP